MAQTLSRLTIIAADQGYALWVLVAAKLEAQIPVQDLAGAKLSLAEVQLNMGAG